MPIVRTDDGVRIAYATHGDGPRNMFFLHGWGGSARYWDEVLQNLDLSGLRAIAASFRGHGDSDKPATAYSIERFADDMFAVANDAQADKFVLVGFSMGGKYAQYMAATRPDRVVGLVLIAPVGAAEFPLPQETERSFCEAAGNPDRIKTLLAPLSKVPIRRELIETYLTDFVKIPRAVLEGTFGMFSRTTFVDQVKAITAPTLVIGGEYDPFMPRDYLLSEVVSRIPGARLVELPCGHELPHELPRETTALLTAFLAGLRWAA